MPIRKRRNGWYIDICVDGKRIRKSAKTRDEHTARILEQTMLGLHKRTTPRQNAIAMIDLILPPERQGVRLEDLATWYSECLTDEKADTGTRTIRQRLSILRCFVEWARTESSAQYSDDITVEHACAYQRVLGSRGILGKTLNAYCADISTVWKMLQKRSKVRDNPWTLVRVRRDKENEHTGRAFTREEFDRLLKVCREVGHEWDGMLIIGAYTGLRMPDVSTLRWDEVDMERGRINLTPDKTKRYGIQVSIPMHSRVLAYLKARPRGGEFVMPWRASHPAGYKARGDDVSFAQILSRAGIAKKSESDKLSYHCLRHTFVSWLAESGAPEDVRMKLAGHTNADTHAIYTHADARLARAIEALQ